MARCVAGEGWPEVMGNEKSLKRRRRGMAGDDADNHCRQTFSAKQQSNKQCPNCRIEQFFIILRTNAQPVPADGNCRCPRLRSRSGPAGRTDNGQYRTDNDNNKKTFIEMAKKEVIEKEKEQQRQEKVIETVSKTDQFFRENKKAIYGTLAALVVIAVAIVAYLKFYYQPKCEEATAQMFPAEANFRNGEFDLALNGDGNVLGFAQIISDFGTKGGKDVYFYAGVCELQLGNYQNAIDYLKKYNGKDKILAARAEGCIGDAYVGLEKYSEALSCFEKAAAKADNMFAAGYLLKAGVVCEELGDNAKALTFYKKIKDQYAQSIEGYDIDKYITRIESQTK